MVTADATKRKQIVNRLKRARGQLDALVAAVEAEDDCRDVLTQLSALTHALNRSGFLIVATAMQECVADDEEAEVNPERVTLAELEKLFLNLA